MKKLFFAISLLLLVNISVFSQSFFTGGAIILSHEYSFKEHNSTKFKLSPEIGYNINRFDIGLCPFFQYYNYKYAYSLSGSYKEDSLGYGIGLFFRYNIIEIYENLTIRARLDTNYVYQEGKRPSANMTFETNSYNVSLSPILQLKLNDRISIYSSIIGSFLNISYQTRNEKIGNNYSEESIFVFSFPLMNEFSLNDVSFGFYFYF